MSNSTGTGGMVFDFGHARPAGWIFGDFSTRQLAQPAVKQVAPTHVATSKRSNKHGDSRSQEREPVSTLYR